MRWLAVMACVSCAPGAAVVSPIGNEGPEVRPGLTSHLAAPWVVVEPDGPRFRIPTVWTKRGAQLHFTREELEDAHVGGGEYHAEAGEIVDAVLPFERCAFAGGVRSWGEVGYEGDTQMRVYVLPDARAAVEKRIEDRGTEVAREIETEARAAARERRAVDPTRERTRWLFTHTAIDPQDPWHEDTFRLPLAFADGEHGNLFVQCFVRELSGSTVVVVLMYRVPGDDARVAIRTMKP